MNAIPSGWFSTQLGNVIELRYGKALPNHERSGAGYPVYGSNGIVGYHHTALTLNETIVVGRKGSVGEVCFSMTPCSPIDTTYYVDRFPFENPKYWFYKLRQLDLGTLNKSTAIPGFNRADAYALTILLPPLAEQKRIADKLDTVLARVDACRERLNRIPLLLKRFRQSVLAAAISGRLTEDWNDNPNIISSKRHFSSGHFSVYTLDKVAEFISGFAYKSEDFSEEGVHQVIKIANVKDGALLLCASKAFIPGEIADQTLKFKTQPHDILISMTGTKSVVSG